jgi:uncharacterized membrane protein YcjF (UPF0283 family)
MRTTKANLKSKQSGFIEFAFLVAIVVAHLAFAGALALSDMNDGIDNGTFDYPQTAW